MKGENICLRSVKTCAVRRLQPNRFCFKTQRISNNFLEHDSNYWNHLNQKSIQQNFNRIWRNLNLKLNWSFEMKWKWKETQKHPKKSRRIWKNLKRIILKSSQSTINTAEMQKNFNRIRRALKWSENEKRPKSILKDPKESSRILQAAVEEILWLDVQSIKYSSILFLGFFKGFYGILWDFWVLWGFFGILQGFFGFKKYIWWISKGFLWDSMGFFIVWRSSMDSKEILWDSWVIIIMAPPTADILIRANINN